MITIALFGIVIILCGAIMLGRPNIWILFWTRFSCKSYFHWTEICSRAVFAFIFLKFGNETRYPAVMEIMGYLMIIATIALLIMGSRKHRAFALKSMESLGPIFRPAGIVAILFGAFLYCSAL